MPPKALIYITDETTGKEFREAIEHTRARLGIEITDDVTKPPYTEETYDRLEEAGVRCGSDNEEMYPENLESHLKKARDGKYDHVIVPHLHTLSESMRDVHKTVDSLAAHEVTVHVTARSAVISPCDREKRALLYAASELERRENTRQIDPHTAGERHKGGRPPVGYTVSGGYRRPADNYDEVEATLHEVVEGTTSIHAAAARLNVSRTTIRNAVQKRSELYGLPVDAELPSQ